MASRQGGGPTTRRLEALTDGIYAIAMTILILNLRAPGAPITVEALTRALARISGLYVDFGISFLLLAFFWVVHHRQFEHIERVDGTLLWINIISLMLVATIPFTTSIYGGYRQLTPAAWLLEGNILVLGLVEYFQWAYATSGHRLVAADLDPRHIAMARRASLIVPLVSLVAMAAAIDVPAYSTAVYLMVPLLWVALSRR